MSWHSWLWSKLGLCLLALSCAPRLPELQEIEAQQAELRRLLSAQGAQSSAFLTAALQLVRKEQAFVQKYPNHPKAPELLFEAAELEAVYFNEPRRAIELLRQIDVRYRKKSPYAPKALFYEAFLYENMLSDTARARELYELFLQEYPQHELSPQAQLALRNLGKSPDQLLREFLRDSLPQ